MVPDRAHAGNGFFTGSITHYSIVLLQMTPDSLHLQFNLSKGVWMGSM